MKAYKLKNGFAFTVREAEREDAYEILMYLKKVGAESNFLTFGAEGAGIDVKKEEDIIKRYKIAPNSVMLVGTVGRKLASVASLTSGEKSRLAHNSEIGISVLKEFWGLGVGTIMMTELIDFAKSTGFLKVIHLSVMSENERAIALYKKLGFEETGYHKSFSKIENKFMDAVLMDYML